MAGEPASEHGAGAEVAMTLWRAALLRPPYAELTYAAPAWLPSDAWREGQRALAPLGKGLAAVVLCGREESAPEGLEVKPLLWPLERDPLLPAASLRLARALAARALTPLGQVLTWFLPAGLRTTQVRYELSGFGLPKTLTPKALAALPERDRELAGGLWAQERMAVRDLAARRELSLSLAVDPPWPLRPGAARQAAILEYLYEHGPAPRARLLAALGAASGGPLKQLLGRGLVREAEAADEERPPACAAAVDPAGHAPTAEQAAALEDLFAALASGQAQTRLLYGVTGSGKTHVYLRLARQCLEQGRSALLLAPEVALACGLWRAAVQALPSHEVLLCHGYQSPAARERVFRRAAQGKPLAVVGTRSALFLPVARPGLVVLDEEHDESFKQEERLPYQAKEVAWFLAREAGALLVLGSATPDVKTFHAAEAGAMGRLTMGRRVGAGGMPAMELVDLRAAGQDPLAPLVREELAAGLAAGEQSILMLNRRGYAPLMYCLDCNETLKCPQCSVGLTYHKGRERLLCHYCGGHEPFPRPCPTCGGLNYLTLGEGTERLEELLTELLPEGTGVLRLDRDTARRQERMEQILADFAAGKAQVLVGTQMLSKGFHFPNVTRVVVADGDLGLNLPDYRAGERTFQLLTQVAGRAGRGDKPGKVFIQTRNPDHPFWEYVLRGDYEGFFRRESDLRKKFGYPPFVRLGLIRFSYPLGMDGGAQWLGQAAEALRAAAGPAGVRVLGPAPAPLQKLQGRQRFNCLLKAVDWPAIRAAYAAARAVKAPADARLSLDLDPVSML